MATTAFNATFDSCGAHRGPVRHGVMNLRHLLAGLTSVAVPDVFITDISLDSRAMAQGGCFIAIPMARSHGVQYAAQAIDAGAAVVLWEPTVGVEPPAFIADALFLAVPGLAALVGRIADRFFEHPSARLTVAGVTGTNGKTTTAHLIASALAAEGQAAAYAGTLGYGRIGRLQSTSHTTPDVVSVHRRLAEFSDDGISHVGMEVSSHALDQHRVDAVRFHTAVFTNLTRDHLDYHKTFDAYGAAKARLFQVPDLEHAVVNTGDPFGEALIRHMDSDAMITRYDLQPEFATTTGTRLFARRLVRGKAGEREQGAGLVVDFDGSWGSGRLNTRLIGDFNAENLLAALAVLLGWELPLDRAVRALESCAAPPGRMEAFAAPGAPLVIVDYAHTPDALEKALRTLKDYSDGRVLCVFGCGGERDAGKRPMMAAIAERLADLVFVTDDNPRGEDGAAIVRDIVTGLAQPQCVQVIRDRGLAIARAIELASPRDAVLIAGKGHEDYQIVGTDILPFSDREQVANLLGLGGRRT